MGVSPKPELAESARVVRIGAVDFESFFRAEHAKRVTLAQPLGPSRGEGKQSLLGICVGHVLPCPLVPDA
ncbi:MAG TPA: hypothetical protein VGQ50_05685 [Actinomycetota bacterium]|jgi:hypothetical protein|nr:hypothetical protein [Actinomycetota bacterium]